MNYELCTFIVITLKFMNLLKKLKHVFVKNDMHDRE
jgi:hypothetical protein